MTSKGVDIDWATWALILRLAKGSTSVWTTSRFDLRDDAGCDQPLRDVFSPAPQHFCSQRSVDSSDSGRHTFRHFRRWDVTPTAPSVWTSSHRRRKRCTAAYAPTMRWRQYNACSRLVKNWTILEHRKPLLRVMNSPTVLSAKHPVLSVPYLGLERCYVRSPSVVV